MCLYHTFRVSSILLRSTVNRPNFIPHSIEFYIYIFNIDDFYLACCLLTYFLAYYWLGN